MQDSANKNKRLIKPKFFARNNKKNHKNIELQGKNEDKKSSEEEIIKTPQEGLIKENKEDTIEDIADDIKNCLYFKEINNDEKNEDNEVGQNNTQSDNLPKSICVKSIDISNNKELNTENNKEVKQKKDKGSIIIIIAAVFVLLIAAGLFIFKDYIISKDNTLNLSTTGYQVAYKAASTVPPKTTTHKSTSKSAQIPYTSNNSNITTKNPFTTHVSNNSSETTISVFGKTDNITTRSSGNKIDALYTTTAFDPFNEPDYKYAKEAEKEGYKNLRSCEKDILKQGLQCYYEVLYDTPNNVVSSSSLGFSYPNGPEKYAMISVWSMKIFIPIPTSKSPYIANYYLVRGVLYKTSFNGEECMALIANKSYIFKSGTTQDLLYSSQGLEW